MSAWTAEELDKIGNAEELEITPLRLDGSGSKWVTIWVVRVGNHLYVRSYKGSGGSWYRGTKLRNQGRIRGGRSRERCDVHPRNRSGYQRPDRCCLPQ